MTERDANGARAAGESASGFDPAVAAALIDDSERTLRRAVDIHAGRQYLAWGLAWLIGLGVMWADTLIIHAPTGPEAWTTILLVALLACALAVTAVTSGRATSGLGGATAFRGRIFGAAWGVGFIGLWLGIAALDIGNPDTRGLIIGASSIGLTGLIYFLGSGLWQDRLMCALGVWLVAVAVGGAFAGPDALLIIGALAGGGGFLAAAVIAGRRR